MPKLSNRRERHLPSSKKHIHKIQNNENALNDIDESFQFAFTSSLTLEPRTTTPVTRSFRDLPFDILVVVFNTVALLVREELGRDSIRWLWVAGVCKNWRTACLSYPLLWTHISPLHWGAEQIDAFMQRSGGLQLVFNYIENESRKIQHFDGPLAPRRVSILRPDITVLSRIRRVRELFIDTSKAHQNHIVRYLYSSLDGTLVKANVLKVLRLGPVVDDDTCNRLQRIFARDVFPSLTDLNLRLSRYTYPSDILGRLPSPTTFKNLARLSFDVHDSEMIARVLELCKDTLKDLKIIDHSHPYMPQYPFIVGQEISPINLSCLRHLHFEGSIAAIHDFLRQVLIRNVCGLVEIKPTHEVRGEYRNARISLVPRLDAMLDGYCDLRIALSSGSMPLHYDLIAKSGQMEHFHLAMDSPFDWKEHRLSLFLRTCPTLFDGLREIARPEILQVTIDEEFDEEFWSQERLATLLENLPTFSHVTLRSKSKNSFCAVPFFSRLTGEVRLFKKLETLEVPLRELEDPTFLEFFKGYLTNRILEGNCLKVLRFLQGEDVQIVDKDGENTSTNTLDALRGLVGQLEVVSRDSEW